MVVSYKKLLSLLMLTETTKRQSNCKEFGIKTIIWDCARV